jgi:hypothetical protein
MGKLEENVSCGESDQPETKVIDGVTYTVKVLKERKHLKPVDIGRVRMAAGSGIARERK